MLDSDSHSAIASDMVENEEGREIPLSSSGTGLENIGQLTITPEGDITTRLISDFEEKDSDMESFIADIQSEYEMCIRDRYIAVHWCFFIEKQKNHKLA